MVRLSDTEDESSSDESVRAPRMSKAQKALLFAKVKTTKEESLARMYESSKRFPVVWSEMKAIHPNGPPEFRTQLLKNRVNLLEKVEKELESEIEKKISREGTATTYVQQREVRKADEKRRFIATHKFVTSIKSDTWHLRHDRKSAVQSIKEREMNRKRREAEEMRWAQTLKDSAVDIANNEDQSEQKLRSLHSRNSTRENIQSNISKRFEKKKDGASEIRAQSSHNKSRVDAYRASEFERAKDYSALCRQEEKDRQLRLEAQKEKRRLEFKEANKERILTLIDEIEKKEKAAKVFEDIQFEKVEKMHFTLERNRERAEYLRQALMKF